MLKEFSWKAFEKTGDIEAYLFFKEITESEENATKEHKAAEEEVAISS